MQVTKYRIDTSFPFKLILNLASVTEFHHRNGAIVNAANESCLGGGGVDGAISKAGGELLFQHRIALPVITSGDDRMMGVRCPVGEARMTGPGNYGSLQVPYVIHAVGPNYMRYDRNDYDTADELLKSAYRESLICAKEAQLEAVAFSLLSAGVFRGERSLRTVLRLGLETICEFEGFEELKEVHIFAFSQRELNALRRVMSNI